MQEYELRFAPKFVKCLKKLEHRTQDQILAVVNTLRMNPRPSGCKKLVGGST